MVRLSMLTSEAVGPPESLSWSRVPKGSAPEYGLRSGQTKYYRGCQAEGPAEGGVYPRREDLLEPAEGDPLPSTPRLGDPTRAEGGLRFWSR